MTVSGFIFNTLVADTWQTKGRDTWLGILSPGRGNCLKSKALNRLGRNGFRRHGDFVPWLGDLSPGAGDTVDDIEMLVLQMMP